MKRQEWMVEPGGGRDKANPLSFLFGNSTPEEKNNNDQPRKSKVPLRELNPYFKDGGTGLPQGAKLLTRDSTFTKPGETLKFTTREKILDTTDEKNETSLNSKKLKEKVDKSTATPVPGDYDEEEEVPSSFPPNKVTRTLVKSPLFHEKRNETDGPLLELEKLPRVERKADYDCQSTLKSYQQIFKSKTEGEEDSIIDSYQSGKKKPTAVHGADDVLRDERQKLILKNSLKIEKIRASCMYCLDSETIDMTSVIAMGHNVYLALPREDSLNELHCVIIPINHSSSMLQCDDDSWDEVRNFKKCLISLGVALGQTVVFLESTTSIQNVESHTHIDAVFLPSNLKTDPRGFFHKALLECDEEWSNNRHLIDTVKSGGLRKSLPRHFPYCYVDFRLDAGFAHIIEDSRKVQPDFLRDLAANLLGLQRHQWKSQKHLKGQKTVVEKFRKLFDPYDWTKLLHQDSGSVEQ